MQLSLFGSTSSRLAKDGAAVPLAVDDARCRGAGKGPWVAEASGFNVHAGVTVRAGDREGLERLCRYCARPPFSLERLSMLPDGRVAYLLRKPRRNGATHLVMTPMQFLARLSSLIPTTASYYPSCVTGLERGLNQSPALLAGRLSAHLWFEVVEAVRSSLVVHRRPPRRRLERVVTRLLPPS
jgi:hypothetical protein